jgi:uncharacterized protein (TIGR03084 family)
MLKQSSTLDFCCRGCEAGRMVDVAAVVRDFEAEAAELDGVVNRLTPEQWQLATPAPGWTIAHQIAHLAWTDEIAVVAVTEPERFSTMAERAAENVDEYADRSAHEGAKAPPEELLARWRASRRKLADALLALPAGRKIQWFGPPMSAASMATARLMETWAHGQDVVDTLGIERVPTERLRHVVHIAVRTRDFAYSINGLTPPGEQFRVELTGPTGQVWTWGPEDAGQRVTGNALDFALLATQRRHRDDCAVHAVGPDAERWLEIAQAFAGPPGKGRQPGQFA